MKHLILILLAVVSLAVQDTPRHDKYKDDAQAYCWNPATSGTQVEHRKRDPHAHQCACHLTCQMGPDNEVIGDQEDQSCELWCTRERCTCHVEEPCEKEH